MCDGTAAHKNAPTNIWPGQDLSSDDTEVVGLFDVGTLEMLYCQ